MHDGRGEREGLDGSLLRQDANRQPDTKNIAGEPAESPAPKYEVPTVPILNIFFFVKYFIFQQRNKINFLFTTVLS